MQDNMVLVKLLLCLYLQSLLIPDLCVSVAMLHVSSVPQQAAARIQNKGLKLLIQLRFYNKITEYLYAGIYPNTYCSIYLPNTKNSIKVRFAGKRMLSQGPKIPRKTVTDFMCPNPLRNVYLELLGQGTQVKTHITTVINLSAVVRNVDQEKYSLLFTFLFLSFCKVKHGKT